MSITMSVWGKILVGAAGLALGGPIGALIGAAAGHAIDKIADNSARVPIDEEQSKRKIAFTIGVIVLSAKMAKADGVVTRNEIAAFRSMFHVPSHEVKNVAKVWDLARKDSSGFEVYARQIVKLFNPKSLVLEEILGNLINIAKADGKINADEISYLEQVGIIFGFDQIKLHQLLAIYGASNDDDPFTILGIEFNATDTEIKKAYRQLTLKNHPDKLIAEGMPEEFIRQATDKMASINDAYSRLMQKRNST
jgi:DnaJ like chaperone protein